MLLSFQDGAFKDPFIDKYVSDGTIKMDHKEKLDLNDRQGPTSLSIAISAVLEKLARKNIT